MSVPIVWKACYELENNAKDILRQGKQIFPRRDRLYYYAANINYYLSTLQQEVDGNAQPSVHWSGVWAEMQELVRDTANQYKLLSSSIDEVPDGSPLTQRDLATYPSGPWRFRDPAKAIVADASKIKRLLLVVSTRLGRSPNQSAATGSAARGTTSNQAGGTASSAASGATTGSAGDAANDAAIGATTGPAGDAANDAAIGETTGSAGDAAYVAAIGAKRGPADGVTSSAAGAATSGPTEITASSETSGTTGNSRQGARGEQESSSGASPPAKQTSSVKPDNKKLTGQAHRLQARVGTKLVGQTAKKIQASATSLVNELERWNLLCGQPPAQGTSTIRFGGGLTPAQVLTQFYYLPSFTFTMPSYTQFSYRLPPRHKFLVYYTREAGKLINLMNREIEATSFTQEQMAVARGPWSEVQNIFSDLVAHYMELYTLVNEYNDERLKKNILEDQLRFGRSIVAIHDDMDRLSRVLSDVNSIVKQ